MSEIWNRVRRYSTVIKADLHVVVGQKHERDEDVHDEVREEWDEHEYKGAREVNNDEAAALRVVPNALKSHEDLVAVHQWEKARAGGPQSTELQKNSFNVYDILHIQYLLLVHMKCTAHMK